MAKTPTKKSAAEKKLDPQSGMEPSGETDKASVKKQFDEADAKGAPSQEEIDEATLSRSIRGY
jgi:hypothetical protein